MTFYLINRDMASLGNVDMRLVTLLRRLFHLMFSDFSWILSVEAYCKRLWRQFVESRMLTIRIVVYALCFDFLLASCRLLNACSFEALLSFKLSPYVLSAGFTGSIRCNLSLFVCAQASSAVLMNFRPWTTIVTSGNPRAM